MDADPAHDASSPTEDVNTCETDAESNRISSLEGISSDGDIIRELESAEELLTRVELDLACFSEKLVNLNVLVMHVAAKESDFEAFTSEKEHISSDSVEKEALEFDLLSGILDSEVRELDSFMCTLRMEIVNACEIVSSFEHLGDAFKKMDEMLRDSEKALKQSLEQFSEIKLQSANFQRILLSFLGEDIGKDNKGMDFSESGDLSNLNVKIKMQTAEHQRHILRMLEKSLARELDLDKKVTESRQIEEDLKLRLQEEVFCREEEAAVTCERLFEAENSAEILIGISKGLLGQLQIVQFNLNGSFQREGELRSQLQGSNEQLKTERSAVQKLESTCLEYREMVSSLEKQLKESEFQLQNEKASAAINQELCSEIHEMKTTIENLKEKNSKAENKSESAEAKFKLMTETNMELSERVNSLERQLRESDIQLQNAMASDEASQEKQTMLDYTIRDMENLIEDLKAKVLKVESQTESAEEKCIILSESNSDLNEELSFLRGRMECLEASLHQAEETKRETAKDIKIRTKLITDLVMQLALERERLHKQISSLTKENKVFVKHFQLRSKDPSVTMTYDGKGLSKEFSLTKHELTTTTCTRESTKASVDKTSRIVSSGETENGLADSTTKLDNVRNIDATQLNYKYVFVVVIMLAIPVLAAFLFQHLHGQC